MDGILSFRSFFPMVFEWMDERTYLHGECRRETGNGNRESGKCGIRKWILYGYGYGEGRKEKGDGDVVF